MISALPWSRSRRSWWTFRNVRTPSRRTLLAEVFELLDRRLA